MYRTVVVLIDHPRAYDEVWREALLMKMSINYYSKSQAAVAVKLSVTAKPRTWVTFHGVTGRTEALIQGVWIGPVFVAFLHSRPDISGLSSTSYPLRR